MKKPFAIAVCLLAAVLCAVIAVSSNLVEKPMLEPAAVPASVTAAPASVDEAMLTTEYLSIPQGNSQIIAVSKDYASQITGWESANPKVAEVDSGGRMDAVALGTTTLTASLSTGQSVDFEVTVTENIGQAQPDKFSTAITANDNILQKNIEELEDEDGGDKNLYEVHVNRHQSCVTVYTFDEKGDYTIPVRAMLCSCGKNHSTIVGEFEIYFKSEWHALYNNVYGQYVSGITGDFLFHSVPYAEMEDNSSLEIEEFNKLGSEASLGCVRMAVEDTRWIYENCPIGTTVKIYDKDIPEPLGRPAAIRINGSGLGWDPTDRKSGNPYNSRLPQITGAKDKTIRAGDDYSPKDGVKAIDTCGSDITEKIYITGNVVTSRKGKYKVTYTVTDALNRSASTDVWITVS